MKRNRTFWGAFLFGIGMIGMLDGIIFHQILQWHSVYMDTTRHNQIVSDGLFHLAVTAVLFTGTLILWKSRTPGDDRSFWGGFLVGGGLFNLVEGIVNHHILQIHHVQEHTPDPLPYDLAFDAVSILLLLAGWWLSRSAPSTQS
ncbi:DUF2243 domain-containing protein [Staphylospora marina]|uniref:DUF2243 domain-containing protein n=1 Tax=Staphylospora marina TaxID=2490858 RepID=UPI000F5BD749|nr:DUF2243 domain-containing protein [Staphylospora marina]